MQEQHESVARKLVIIFPHSRMTKMSWFKAWIHSDEGLKLETSVFESFTVANLPY